MYKYKRGINKIEEVKQVEYTLSDNLDTCLSLSACLEASKIYNGLYIKSGKVMISNISEEIEIKNMTYKLAQINSTSQNISSDEYITEIDLNKNTFTYDLDKLAFTKKLAFEPKTGLLCIEYNIVNRTNNNAKFKVMPYITYRDLFATRNASMLKFNQRKDKEGVVLNLSITDQEDIIMKSKEFSWSKDVRTITDITHNSIINNEVKKVYKEDLLCPGEFELVIKGNKEVNAVIYISSHEFNIDDLSINEIFNEISLENKKIVNNIEEQFVELKDLALAINNLCMDTILVDTLPYKKENSLKIESNLDLDISVNKVETLLNIVKSIDGQYLTFNKIKEATRMLVKIRRYIKDISIMDIKDKEFEFKFSLLKLWYIEISNKLIQKEEVIDLFFDFLKELLYSVLDSENKTMLLSNIEVVSLTYNAIKIYENMLANKGMEDVRIYEEEEAIKELIENKFWCEEKRTMRKNLNEEEIYSNVEMIYTLSLSYPCIVGSIPVKLLDTIFKELYTPYGLRETAKNSSNNTGLIYPKYMAHFVKANLRQNGVTRASQKIAYNLVKELMLDINHYVNGGIKKIYSEKGVAIDNIGYDLLTNAEMIRLYDMLT